MRSTSGTRRKEHVLLVDDEPQVLVALEDLLSSDFVVMKTSSGEQALELLENDKNLAVVISDQRMPKMSGDELLAEVARRSSAARILVTGYADLTAVIRAVNSGHLFAYVAKPWEAGDLRLKVQLAAEHYRLARELAQERQLLGDLMRSIPDGIFFKDAELRFLRANRPYAELLGADPEGVVGKTLVELSPGGLDAAHISTEEQGILARTEPQLDVIRSQSFGDVRRHFSESKAPIRGTDGRIVGIVGITRDVTQRVEQDAAIERLTKVRNLLSGINASVLRASDSDSLIRDCCRVALEWGDLRLAGVTAVDRRTGTVEILAVEPASSALASELQTSIVKGGVTSEFLLRVVESGAPMVVDDVLRDGVLERGIVLAQHGVRSIAALPVERSGVADCVFWLGAERVGHFDQDEIQVLTEVAHNISFALAGLSATKRLDFLAHYDEVTHLPNRRLLLDRATQWLDATRSDGRRLALVMLDVGRFRQVNETFGWRGGDELLSQIAQRLQVLTREGGTLSRVDGNVFALLIPDSERGTSVASFLEDEVLAAFRQSFLVRDTEVRVAVRVGVAVAPADGDSAEVLIGNAEAALKKTKATGQPYLFYAPTMNARVSEQLALETKLRRAVEREEFVLHYQPKVDLATGDLVGLEALIRWQVPEGGLVAPGLFIPVLEETGLIREVGRWVFERAALQYHDWERAGLAPPRIAVNVSVLQLAARDFVQDLERVLRHYPSGAGVDLEITESVFVGDLAGSIQKLEAARAHGLRVAIDDFGTGYSSLAYLGRLPIDALKIDRSFVMRMMDDPQTTSVVTTIISLAHALGLHVIAEGVETTEQARLLRLLKCDQAQGYLIARPEPVEEIQKRIGSRFDLGVTSIR